MNPRRARTLVLAQLVGESSHSGVKTADTADGFGAAAGVIGDLAQAGRHVKKALLVISDGNDSRSLVTSLACVRRTGPKVRRRVRTGRADVLHRLLPPAVDRLADADARRLTVAFRSRLAPSAPGQIVPRADSLRPWTPEIAPKSGGMPIDMPARIDALEETER
jgi:hypothetical protein